MTKQQAIRKSIAHWKRMVRWAKKQDPLSITEPTLMAHQLGEIWFCRDCPLCRKYQSCTDCPLKSCGRGSAWGKVRRGSRTWGTWVQAAEQHMLPALEELLEGKTK